MEKLLTRFCLCMNSSNKTRRSRESTSSFEETSMRSNQVSNMPRIRLFVMGNAEAGKSTFIKQLQKLCITKREYQMFDECWNHQVPFSELDCLKAKRDIHQCVFRVIGTLIQQAELINLRYDHPLHADYAREIQEYLDYDLDFIHQKDVVLTKEMAWKIQTLWETDRGAIGGAWNRRREFVISDSAAYFLDTKKLQEIACVHYSPSMDDMLRVRDPTTGFKDYNFTIRNVPFTFRDVGGQPAEKTRLIFYLQSWIRETREKDRNFVLFISALSDYNQKNPRHPERTMLDESVEFLKILLNRHELNHCGFLLFLNKQDIFGQKLQIYQDFNHYFHQYHRVFAADRRLRPGQAERVVANHFSDAVRTTLRAAEPLYCKFTTAVDSTLMEAIFAAVRSDIVEDRIRRGHWNPFP